MHLCRPNSSTISVHHGLPNGPKVHSRLSMSGCAFLVKIIQHGGDV